MALCPSADGAAWRLAGANNYTVRQKKGCNRVISQCCETTRHLAIHIKTLVQRWMKNHSVSGNVTGGYNVQYVNKVVLPRGRFRTACPKTNSPLLVLLSRTERRALNVHWTQIGVTETRCWCQWQMKSVFVLRSVNVMIISASSVSIKYVNIKQLNFVHRSFYGKVLLVLYVFFIPSVCSKKQLFSDWHAFPAALQCQEAVNNGVACKPSQLVLLFCFFFFFFSGWLFDQLFDIQPGGKVNSFVLD